jgi:hypothetical protein
MSTAFEIPEWLLQAPLPPTPVDDHRVEALVNRFIAGKQEALFTAPDAFYRLQGADAVQGQPAIADRLRALRAATLDLASDEGERAALEPRLDLHIDDASDGINRHVAEQHRVYQRQVLSQRQALIKRATELEHDNDDKIMGLAEANATAAGEQARMDGLAPDSPEAAAATLGARSNILRTAIDERIANRRGAQALALFDRVQDQLAPADRLSLDTPLQAARYEQVADQWIDRESKTDGPPLQQRLEADTNLPSKVNLLSARRSMRATPPTKAPARRRCRGWTTKSGTHSARWRSTRGLIGRARLPGLPTLMTRRASLSGRNSPAARPRKTHSSCHSRRPVPKNSSA